jgi:hypothetical protein
MTDTELPGGAGDERPDDPAQGGAGQSSGEDRQELAPEDWQDSEELGSPEITPQEMAVYHSTLRRVERWIGMAGVLCAVAVVWPLGWAVAVGVLLGTILGWINFRWLSATVHQIGERIVKAKSQERGVTVVVRGVGRVFLIVLFGYVIFTYSVRGLEGFLAGLAMPVVALMCEAVYEFIAGSRRLS